MIKQFFTICPLLISMSAVGLSQDQDSVDSSMELTGPTIAKQQIQSKMHAKDEAPHPTVDEELRRVHERLQNSRTMLKDSLWRLKLQRLRLQRMKNNPLPIKRNRDTRKWIT